MASAVVVESTADKREMGGWVESNHSFLFCLNCNGDQNKPLRLPLVSTNDDVGGTKMAMWDDYTSMPTFGRDLQLTSPVGTTSLSASTPSW